MLYQFYTKVGFSRSSKLYLLKLFHTLQLNTNTPYVFIDSFDAFSDNVSSRENERKTIQSEI